MFILSSALCFCMMFECELRVWESMPCYRTPPRRASRAASFRVIVIIIKSTEMPHRASSYKYHEYKWNKNQTQVQNFPRPWDCVFSFLIIPFYSHMIMVLTRWHVICDDDLGLHLDGVRLSFTRQKIFIGLLSLSVWGAGRFWYLGKVTAIQPYQN